MKQFTWRWRLTFGMLLIMVCGAGVPDFLKAIRTGDVKAVKAFLETNPKLTEFKDTNGYTPLHLTAGLGQSDIASLLLSHGADPNAVALDGFTPLHVAAARGHLAVVEALLERRARINAKTAKGDTPLLLASMEDRQQVVQLLRKHGATISGASVMAEVGNFGDPMRLEFAGNETFSAQALRRGLMADSTFLLAAHPLAPRSDFQQALPARLRKGYQSKGFPDAKASATFDEPSGTTRVLIWEGPRFKAGKVLVSGAKIVSAEEIIRRLTQPYWNVPFLEKTAGNPGDSVSTRLTLSRAAYNQPQFLSSSGEEIKRQEPVWSVGDWADFASVGNYEKAVTKILNELAGLRSHVQVGLVRDDASKTASLEVKIIDEGQLPIIAEVEITGNVRNSREDILNYLNLQPNMPFRPDLISELEHRLWSSGRFLSYQIIPATLLQNSNQLKLILKLKEHEKVSLLKEPFSREETALLKFREWLLNAPQRGEDLVLFSKSKGSVEFLSKSIWEGMQLVLSTNGLLCQLFRTNSSGIVPGYALELAADRFALYTPLQQTKWVAGYGKQRVAAFMKWLPHEDKVNKTQTQLSFGAGFVGGDIVEPTDPPVRMDLFLAPVVLLAEAHREGTTLTWEKDVMKLKGRKGELRVDEKTGRFLGMTYNANGGANYEQGAFANARKTLETATATHRNTYDPARPMTAAISFLMGELPLFSAPENSAAKNKHARALAVCQKILAKGVLTPLEDLWQSNSNKTEFFSIPLDHTENNASQLETIIRASSAYIFSWSNQLFPPGSWPWVLTREIVYVLGAKGNYTQLELKRLYDSDEMGPVGCWSVSQLLALAGFPQSRLFAERGLDRLSPVDFRKDWQLLLASKTPLADCVTRTLHAARDLSDEDLDALTSSCKPETAVMLRAAIQSLRADKSKSPAEILAPFLNAWWEKSLRGEFETSFKKLQNSSKK